ncbi:DUF7674 family protein [Hymenobacter sp. GOD-10R]|uniref:DUF7674 family protein n=1 Tax=Hymenobacter sp. GOD-10R TaxID=3093922 RepID=UPI002D774F2C|nr:T9SS type A sorting domain-containing protein [Hymenobacter sp. GOD-10R]WRQ31628.1 T9SS type A sorting domain-containing protein [Hymenobacter sp. GOD-10R]
MELIPHQPALTRARFLAELVERFPAVAEDVREHEGLSHLQASAWARYANTCVAHGHLQELARVIDYFQQTVEQVDSTTENALYVSFLEHSRTTNLSAHLQPTLDFIRQQQAGGGGDFPEAVDQALAVAVNDLSWTPHAKARLLFLILDAPPHENPQVLASLQQSIRKAAAKGIRLIPLAASGIDKSTEYLMRSLALATNGTYVFLTDDSGVGEAHLKPTTDQFEVEQLTRLLVKLVTKYAYTADCQAPTPSLAGPPKPVVDTAAVAPTTARPAKASAWKCYPNPTSDILHVEWEGEIKELLVTDVTGKVVLRTLPAHHQAAVQLSNFPTGIYFVRFFTGKKWEQARFLVRR